MIIAALSLLIFHGLLGGADVVLNHEILERLPSRLSARTEEALHSAREFIFAALFGALAWFQWTGMLAWAIVALLVSEIAVSLVDTLVEDRMRPLSVTERTMHVILFVNFGAYVSLLVPELIRWHAMPTGLHVVDYGPWSWALSALSIGAAGWSIRDGLSYAKLSKGRDGKTVGAPS